MLKLNNLKKIWKMIGLYAASLHLNALPKVNLTSIAKEEDPKELANLMKFVIAVAVQCPRNQFFVESFQRLSVPSQQAIMQALELVIYPECRL